MSQQADIARPSSAPVPTRLRPQWVTPSMINYKEKLPEPLRPRWHPLLAIVFLLGVNWMNFSSAAAVEIPPSPNELRKLRSTSQRSKGLDGNLWRGADPYLDYS